MNAVTQALWLFVFLITLSCSGWYFARTTNLQKLDEHTLKRTADIIVEHLSVQQFDTEGQQVHFFTASLMRHTSLNETHWFKDPYIIVAQKDQPDCEISAKQALSLNKGEQITFNKEVIIHQDKDAHHDESTLKTDSITYFPKDKIATTLDNVRYETAGNIVQSKGMKAYLAEKRVRLLSEARGIYEPPKS